MRRGSGSDHLAHSFTDLMTSLMVIFILLLLVFLNNQATVNTTTTQALLKEMQQSLASSGLKPENVRLDQKDPFTIVIAVPNELMTFETNRHALKPEGESFVHREMPRLAHILCAPKYRSSVENVIVEGHSDNAPYHGATPEESQSRNLKLSQDRSMEVVQQALASLTNEPAERSCFLEKLSASGRGEQDLLPTSDKSRRVEIKVRVNASQGAALLKATGGRAAAPPAPAPALPNEATLRVLDLIARLRATPHQHVSFRLSQDEINDYLTFALRAMPRPGLDSVSVKFFPRNYISTLTVIDFDNVARWNPLLIPPMLHSVLQGKRSVLVDYRFHVQDGKATFTIEKAYYQNTRLPHFLVRQVLQSIAAQQPERLDLDQAVPLPFGLRTFETAQGTAIGQN